jgi:hypothetical protein
LFFDTCRESKDEQYPVFELKLKKYDISIPLSTLRFIRTAKGYRLFGASL